MFEQATLSSGPAGKRAFTTLLGLTSQAALVSIAVLVPMVWPQVLPITRLEISLAPPVPPGPKRLGDEVKKQPTRTRVVRATALTSLFVEPSSVPTHIMAVIDEPAAEVGVVGALPSNMGGTRDGVPGGFMQDLFSTVQLAPPRIIVDKPAAKAPVEAPPVVPRYTQGGNVRLGAPLHKGEPQYPQLAKASHTTGDVTLECVVGVDGHIKEVKVKSGNPLLIRAAVDAAWQWVYAPSKLNGVPIEIVTYLTFSFKLN